MAADANHRTGLLFRSGLTALLFVACLFAVEFVLLRQLAGPSVAVSTKGLTSDEILLYRNSIRNFGVLFDRELRSGQEEAGQLAAVILDDLAAGRMKNVQKHFASFRSRKTDVRHVFLINRFGRLLAVDPYTEKHHNKIYDFTRYDGYFRGRISRRAPSTAFYHYLLDQDLSSLPVIETGDAAQQPFVTAADLESSGFRQKLTKPLLSPSGLSRGTGKRPLVLFAAGCVSRGAFWGYAGYGVALSSVAAKVLDEFPENLFLLFAFNKAGHILYGPAGASEGIYAGEDPVVRALLRRVESGDKSGLLEADGRVLFYHQEGSVIFAGFPVKYLQSPLARFSGSFPAGLPWQAAVFFLFQIVLFLLLFLLYHRHIIRPVREMVSRHAPPDLVLDGGDEFSLIRTMLEHPMETGRIETFLFEPSLVTSLPMKVDEERPQMKVKDFRNGSASAVFVSLHNIAEMIEMEPALAAKYFKLIYRLALEFDGLVKNFSFNSFMVYFGIPEETSDHPVKAAAFFTRLLKLTRKMNAEPRRIRIRIGVAAETGLFSHGRFVFGKQEEQFILSPLVHLVQKYEVLTQDNVAVFSDAFFQAAENVEDRYIRQKARIKVRDWDDPVDVYVFRV